MLLSGILDHKLVDLELPPSQQIVEWLRTDRLRLDAIVRSSTTECPRLVLGFHPPHGFSILLLETEASEGLFVCRDHAFGPPEILVQFSRVDAELWPVQLFVDDSTVCRAIDHVRETGRAAPTLTWVASGDFPRTAIRLDGRG
jgi:hypothetical protein